MIKLIKLIKISENGFEKEFENKDDLRKFFYSCICDDCRVDQEITEDSSYEDMLFSTCGAEYWVR